MEIRHLRYFVAVADELHFTKAAAKLRTAQPSLSQQIRRLERELGAELLVRTNRSVELTDAGRVFLEHARRVLAEADRARDAVSSAIKGELGTLTIGFASTTADELLPELFVSYRAHHPGVDLTLRELRNPDQIRALLDGQLDVGLGTHRIVDPRLSTMVLRQMRLVIAMPAHHPLAGRRDLRLQDLATERWIHPLGHWGPLHAACARAGFEPLIVHEETQHATRMMLVAAGVGLALDMESTLHPATQHIVYRPLVEPELTVQLVAVWRPERSSLILTGFLDTARAVAASTRDAPSAGFAAGPDIVVTNRPAPPG